MLKRVAFVVCLALLVSTAALADNVQYSTTATWTQGSASVVANGLKWSDGSGDSLTLTFTGSGAQNVIVPFGSANMGGLTATLVGSATNLGIGATGSGFTLNVLQTYPGSDTGSFVGSLQGNITFSNTTSGPGQVLITFSNTSIFLQPGILYTLNNLGDYTGTNSNNQLNITLPSGDGSAPTQLNATITTPEPTSMLLFGTGLTGIAGLIRRKSKKNA